MISDFLIFATVFSSALGDGVSAAEGLTADRDNFGAATCQSVYRSPHKKLPFEGTACAIRFLSDTIGETENSPNGMKMYAQQEISPEGPEEREPKDQKDDEADTMDDAAEEARMEDESAIEPMHGVVSPEGPECDSDREEEKPAGTPGC